MTLAILRRNLNTAACTEHAGQDGTGDRDEELVESGHALNSSEGAVHEALVWGLIQMSIDVIPLSTTPRFHGGIVPVSIALSCAQRYSARVVYRQGLMTPNRSGTLLRLIGLWSAAALLLASCTLFFDPEISGEVVDGPIDTGSDTPDLGVDADLVDVPIAYNTCGGEGALGFRGDPGAPGVECGECDDGLYACNGPNGLRCVGASPANVCGDCHIISDAPGQPCGACGDGVFQCDAGDLTCLDASDRNLCGGCAELQGRPGFVCETELYVGTWVCTDRESVDCLDGARNPCGGFGGLFVEGEEAQLGDRCGSDECGEGVLVCVEGDENALECIGTYPRNECGECTELAGDPGEVCGACGGTWQCSEDGRRVVCTETSTNICGGCSELEESVGTLCNDGTGIWVCSGAEDVICSTRTVERNACGGADDLGLPADTEPGDECGTCDTGTWQCTGLNRVECRGDEGEDARNVCEGCATLPLTIGTPCGECGAGTWACDPDAPDFPICDGLSDDPYNVCGGCDPLSDAPGEACAECNVFECVGTGLLCVPDVGADECAAAITCAELDCAEFGFECFESVGGANAYCADCLEGLTFRDGECSSAGTCGDGVVDFGEKCDDEDLDDQSCESLGRDGGELACADDCTFDTTGCAPECLADCSERSCGFDPVCGLSCGECSDEATCRQGRCVNTGLPVAPNFRASSGDTAQIGEVLLQWDEVPSAEAYLVFRDDERIARVESGTLNYGDPDAEPGTLPALAIAVASNDNEEFIGVTWDPATVLPGSAHTYMLKIEQAGAEGPAAFATGNRALAPVTEYAVRVEDGEWFSVGTDLGYEDRAFPPPTLAIDRFDASNDRPDGVELTVESIEATPTPVRYQVGAVSVLGTGEPVAASGEAATNPILTWRKNGSSADSGEYLFELGSGPELSFLDTDALTDTRWYVVELSSNGSSITSGSEPGALSPADCSDGVINGSETDVDCGGDCAPCLLGSSCDAAEDCRTGGCFSGVCRGVEVEFNRPGAGDHEQLGSTTFAGRRGVVSGATYSPDRPFGPGSVEVFTLEGLSILDQTSVTAALANGSALGTRAFLFGDALLISSLGGGAGDVGTVRAYGNLDGWFEAFVLEGPGAGDGFGSALVAIGDDVFVGAPTDGLDGAAAGLVEVWRPKESTSSPAERLRGRRSSSGDRYGSSLAVSGSHLLVGVPGGDTGGVATGTVEAILPEDFFRVELSPPVVASGREFGEMIHADDQWVAVLDAAGTEVAMFENDGGVFRYDVSLSLPPFLATGDGSTLRIDSIAVGGGRVAMGVGRAVFESGEQGGVVLYGEGDAGWEFEGVAWMDLNDGDRFGESVYLLGDLLFVGAPGRDLDGTDTGAVYRIELCPGVAHGPFCQFSCSNGTHDGFEGGTDCGGAVCDSCGIDSDCSVDEDCPWRFGATCADGFCREASCDDGVRNGGESDIDCGRECPDGCVLGRACGHDDDCQRHLVCEEGFCAANACGDGVVNGDETGVDCGGSVCPRCPSGHGCATSEDCEAGLDCSDGVCSGGDSCSNSVLDGDETDVDCGGSVCGPCNLGQTCVSSVDCFDECVAGMCSWPEPSLETRWETLEDVPANLGASVAIERGWVAMGIEDHIVDGRSSGAVAVYGPAGNREAIIEPPTPRDGQRFGASVAISGTTVIIGSPGSEEVYTYSQGDGWSSPGIYTAPPEATGAAGFGGSVAAWGERELAVGAPDGELGFAFVFGEDSAMPDGVMNGESGFGASVALDNGALVIGSPREVAGAGAVRVYERLGESWTPTYSDFGGDGDALGERVDIRGPWIVASAPFSSSSGGVGGAGSVRVYRYDSGWGVHASLEPPDEPINANVGRAGLTVGYDFVVASADVDTFAPNAGVLYMWQLRSEGGGQFVRRFGSSAATEDRGLRHLSSDGTFVLAGAPGGSFAGDANGLGLIYDLCEGDTHGIDCSFSCFDPTQANSETDLNCGGAVCSPCGDGDLCEVGHDCVSGHCASGVCAPGLCENGVQDPTETDIDCGGSCSPCTGEGDTCIEDGDCFEPLVCGFPAFECTFPVDTSCTNTVRDGDETDVDCGGSCLGCGDLQGCVVVEDCGAASGICSAGLCQDSGFPSDQISPSGSAEDYGWAVDGDGSLAIVGDPRADADLAIDAGEAYILKNDGSGWDSRLVLPYTGTAGEGVGIAVAISGDWAAVGAERPAGSGGAVHMFHAVEGVWSFSETLTMPGAHTLDGFGAALAMEDGSLVVGAPNAQPVDATAPGRAFVYEVDGLDSWNLDSTLSPVTDQDESRFGHDVDISGSWIIVGAPGWTPDIEHEGAGGVMFYQDSGAAWRYRSTLGGGSITVGAALGERVAIYGDRAAASQPDGNAPFGVVDLYQFSGDEWEEDSQLLPNASSAGTRFGDAGIEFTDGWLAVGSQHDSARHADQGSAYLYSVTSTSVTFAAAIAPDDANADALGGRVGFAGADLVYGAPGQAATGRVDVFEICPGGTHGPECGYSCGDGSQNGEETAIDEGGPCDGAIVSSPYTQHEVVSDDSGSEEGTAVAATSRYVAVADPEFGGPTGFGRVLISEYRDGAWAPNFVIEPLTGTTPGMRFGSAVAFAGEFLAISAPPVGKVYLYRADTSGWELMYTLDRPAETSGSFGEVMAGADGVLVTQSIGSGGDGEVDVFEFTSHFWLHQNHFVTPDSENVGFGVPATDGETMILGSPQEGTTGAAYVYRRDPLTGWAYDSPITGSGLAAGDAFGSSVAVYGDRAIVGAPGSDGGAGSVHTFRDEVGFGSALELTSGFPAFASQFGSIVTYDGMALWIGARDVESTNEGALYRYLPDVAGWIPDGRVPAPPGSTAAESFAAAMAGWGDWVVAGAPGHSTTGVAYIFSYCSGDSHSACGASSSNGILDGFETDVDCGGPTAIACTEGALCTRDADCEDDSHCSSGQCAPAGFAYIPAGTYTVGSTATEVGRGTDEAFRSVVLTDPFVITQGELTRGAWSARTGGTGGNSDGTCGDDCPVSGVTWYAVASVLNGLTTGAGGTACYQMSSCVAGSVANGDYACASGQVSSAFASIHDCDGWRLPTEVEWEVAARAGSNSAFALGDTDDTDTGCSVPGVDDLGWYCGNATVPNAITTQVPNDWGIYDMHGNAREWTNDSYVVSPPAGTDVATESGGNRTLRGGGWTTSGAATRSAARLSMDPGLVDGINGFRAVRNARRPDRCADGTLNGDEVIADCGGRVCAACP